MSKSLFTAKKLAQLFVDVMLYFPKGLFFTIVDFLDDIRETLLHERIYCAYCDKKLLLPKSSRNKFRIYTNRYFDSLYFALYKITLKLVIFFQFMCCKLLSPSKLETINIFLLKVEEKIKKPLGNVRQYLLKNHYTIAWYGLGALLLLSFAYMWGWGIIPEIYIFCLASSWGGRILNHIANLLIRRQNSDEWLFLKNTANYLRARNSHLESKKEIKALFKKLIIEFSLISILGRFSQFIGYCFQAFFSWLLVYMLVKTTAEQGPQMLQKAEQHMCKSPKAKGQFHYQNVLWVISYKLFKATSSKKAQTDYALLHQQSHQIQEHEPLSPIPQIQDKPLSYKTLLQDKPLSYKALPEYQKITPTPFSFHKKQVCHS